MLMRELKWTAEQVLEFVDREFPQALASTTYAVEELEPRRTRVRLKVTDVHLRPGGTVSGPALMALVDFAVYVLLLAHHGSDARLAVTTGLTISFLNKAGPGDVLCAVELLKHGRTLSVADCRIHTAGDGRLVAHAEATYFMGEAGKGVRGNILPQQ